LCELTATQIEALGNAEKKVFVNYVGTGKKISEGTNPLGISVAGESTTNTVTVVEIDGEKAIKLAKIDNSSRPEFSISLEGVSGYIEISADIKGPEKAAIAYTMHVVDEADSIAQIFHREGDIWHWGHNNSVARDGQYDVSALVRRHE
jgi:hypothetical protein